MVFRGVGGVAMAILTRAADNVAMAMNYDPWLHTL